MNIFAHAAASLVLSILLFSPARGDEISTAEIQDLAERAGVLNSNLKTLRSTAREFDAETFATELEKLEREAKVIAADATDVGAKSVAQSLGDAASSLKKVRRQVEGSESYFMMELTREIDTRLEALETSTDGTVRDLEKLASGAEGSE